MTESTTFVAELQAQQTLLENYFDFHRSDDIRLKGTRVGIENILDRYLSQSESPEEIVKHFYTITLEQVYATILFYLHHQEAVSQYMVDWLKYCQQAEQEQQQNPSPAVQRITRLLTEQKPIVQGDDAPIFN